ncbi:MAG TPA: hypothetical protein VE615_05425 [Gaiellaceae bacterium]|nr:hypothetical protein [Gaiellaceae bacterium]
MPQRRHRLTNSTVALALTAAALALLAMLPNRRRKIRLAPRRLAASLAFTTLFFAGAAFTAGAGNEVAQFLEPGEQSAATTTDTTTTTTEEQPAAEAAAAPEGWQLSQKSSSAESEKLSSATAQPSASSGAYRAQERSAPQSAWRSRASAPTQAQAQSSRVRVRPAATPAWVKRAASFNRAAPMVTPLPRALRTVEREPEADEPGVSATVWLHRALPDPTPPSRRLRPAFARRLATVSARNHVDWALVLGVLRASGERGAVPASPARLQSLAAQLAKLGARRSPWSAVLALRGRTAFADQATALQHYNRAVGLRALVKGLEWAKPSLSKRILRDKRISIYPGGRADIQAGRVNVRIIALIAYLAEAHGQVTVSCLISGHRLYARPGVISAHIYGLAADISVLGGLSIMGNSAPGGMTEDGVRNILLLPSELQPRQVISLLGMGGPSFPMGNHDDHIHVGY